MGLPGAGKTHLAKRLQIHLNSAWYNADKVREMANDWDFSPSGRYRQAERMYVLAAYEHSHDRTVICDFICPTEETRNIFNADITIWMDTIEEGRYSNTNKMFEKPKNIDYRITEFMSDEKIINFAADLKVAHDV